MNKKVLIIIVLLIIAGGAYFVWGKGGTGGYGPVTTVPVGGSATSLQKLLMAGVPVVCTFSTTTASGSESGTFYVANGMAAGDFVANDTNAGAINAHIRVLGEVSYTWTSMSDQGFKSTVSAPSASGQNQSVGYTTQMDYSCQAWKPDTGKFTLPANISFTATASYVPPAGAGAGATGATNTGVKGTAEQCAACNNLAGAQKAQCLVALSCQ